MESQPHVRQFSLPLLVEHDLVRLFVDVPESFFVELEEALGFVDELLRVLVPVIHGQLRGIRTAHPARLHRRRIALALRVTRAARLRLTETVK